MTTTTVPTHDPAREHVAPGTPPPAEQANGPRLRLRGRRAQHVNPRKLIGYTILIVFATIYLYPFAIQIATSFKSDPQATAHPLSLIPNPFDLGAWKRMFGLTSDTSVPIMTWLGNSVLVTVIITTSRCSLTALPVTRCPAFTSGAGA